METIRNNTFETNSSSTHTIVVSNQDVNRIKTPIKVKPSWITEFGWDFETWDNIEEKIAYMIRCLMEYDYSDDKLKAIQERLHLLGIDFDLPTKEEWEDGYVDHADWYHDEIQDIYENDDELLDFLLNGASYIEGGNDNV